MSVEQWFTDLCAALVVAGLAAMALIGLAGRKPRARQDDDYSDWGI